MLVDLVNKYYDKKYDLNCAECMLVAANEEYDLNISKQTLMTMASFGGGMAIGSVWCSNWSYISFSINVYK